MHPKYRLFPVLLSYFIIVLLLGLSSCGIENYLYLNPVSSYYATSTVLSFTLPADQPTEYFRNYRIYYRIYTSATNTTAGATIGIADIGNPAMVSDYNALAPYFSSSENAPVYVQSLLEDQLVYYDLALDGADITELLADNDKALTLDFDPANIFSDCVLTIEGAGYVARRSIINPVPDNTFYYDDLLSTSGDADIEAGGVGYAYAAFVIVAVGIDSNASIVLSAPTFLGILKLPLP